FDDESGREVWDESEVESRGGRARKYGLRARLGVARAYAADCAGRAEDEFLRKLAARHPVHPAANAELASKARFVQLDSLQHAPVFRRERRDVRREAVNRDDTFGRDDGRERLHETPRGVRNNASPLRVQVCARAVGAKLKEGDALEAEVDDEPLFRVLVAVVPDAPVGAQKLCVLFGELVEARTGESVLALDEEAKADGELAESLLISLDRGEARDQIALAVRRAARVELSVGDYSREGPGR